MLDRVLRKARSALRNRARRLRDLGRATYARDAVSPPEPPTFSLAGLFPPAVPPRLLEEADRAVRGEFDQLGSGWVKVVHGVACAGLEGHRYEGGPPHVNRANAAAAAAIRRLLPAGYGPIDWQRDFKSGYRWSERTWYEDVPIGHLPGVDVKVPWELGRLQHLPALALAYGAARRGQLPDREAEAYRTAFRHHVLDFLAANPPRWGVQWRCTMDVAIRAANLALAHDLFRGFGAAFDGDFTHLFWRSLVEHGRHVRHNLEWHPRFRGNHYLCDVVGLLTVAAYLPPGPEVDEWLALAARDLTGELAFQFHADGGNFEASTAYHRLSHQALAFGTAVVRALPPERLPAPLPPWHEEMLTRLARFEADTRHLLMGDNDSGHFLTVPFRAPAPAFSGEPTATAARAYPLFGLYLLRTRRVHLAIRCGPVGQNGNGGHAHNDQLSFELAIDGAPFVIDPGTFVYSPLPEWRNRFRSTASHNTLAPEGREQNPWGPGLRGLFRLEDRSAPRVLDLGAGRFVGEHTGFGPPHRRTLEVFDRRVRGRDECPLPGRKTAYFHLAPAVRVRWQAGEPAVRLEHGGRVVWLRAAGGRVAVWPGFVAPAYGLRRETNVVTVTTEGDALDWALEFR